MAAGREGAVERAKARDVRRSLRLPPPLPSAQGEIRSMGDAAVNQREHAVLPTLIPQDRREVQTSMYFDEAGALRTQACGTVVATSGGDNQSNCQVSRSGCNHPGFFTPYISYSAGPMLTVTTPDHLRASPVPSSQPPERARPPAGGRCGSGTGLTAFNNPLAKRAVLVAGRQPCSTVGVISRRLSQMRVQGSHRLASAADSPGRRRPRHHSLIGSHCRTHAPERPDRGRDRRSGKQRTTFWQECGLMAILAGDTPRATSVARVISPLSQSLCSPSWILHWRCVCSARSPCCTAG
ncbi:hypothetical protein M432DRAFT_114531 [Thermoascus aurantiacus ATCC 26904]